MAGERDVRLEVLLNSTQEREYPSDRNIQNLPESTVSQRQRASEVILYLADAYSTEEGTLVHSFVLLDRFIFACIRLNSSDSVNFIHAAVACFTISLKLRDVNHPSFRDLKDLTSFDQMEITRSEELVLSTLNWNVLSTTGDRFFLWLMSIDILTDPLLTGLDIAEHLLEKLKGRGSFKKYVSFLVQLAHFDRDMFSKSTYQEMAVAAILVACELFQDTSLSSIIPEFMLTERSEQAAAMLGQVAARKGIKRPQPAAGGGKQAGEAATNSPSNVTEAAIPVPA
jgi:hypothetical protein